jgi:hypothetical protein
LRDNSGQEGTKSWGLSMSRWTRTLGLSLLAVVTGACAVQVGGTPTAAPTTGPSTKAFANPDRISAEDALGDLALWNPCSVLDPDALPKSWTATITVPAAFEDCEMSVVTDDGVSAEAQVGYLYRSTHDLDEHKDGQRDGGITVVPDDKDSGACARDIVFADGIALVVRTWMDGDGDDSAAVCEISDTVVDAVLEAVMARKAAPLELPENSIGDIDPCQLVTPDMVGLIPGVAATVDADSQVSRHSCWWSTPGAPGLNIEFEIGKQPTGDSGETLHGRYTTVTQYADDEESSLCAITGEHVKFEVDGESGVMERVGIYVYQDLGQVEQACTAGKKLADALWQKLPPL